MESTAGGHSNVHGLGLSIDGSIDGSSRWHGHGRNVSAWIRSTTQPAGERASDQQQSKSAHTAERMHAICNENIPRSMLNQGLVSVALLLCCFVVFTYGAPPPFDRTLRKRPCSGGCC